MAAVILANPTDLYNLMTGVSSLLANYEIDDNIDNIDMTGFISESIGLTDLENGFQGNFDGKGKTITIGDVSSTYCGLFFFTTSTISNLTVIYKNDGTIIDNITDNTDNASFIASTSGTVTNCHVILPNNVTIGDVSNTQNSGGFIGDTGGTVSNCSLTAGNYLIIRSSESSGGFIGILNGGTITNCNTVIGNNLTITSYGIGGLTTEGVLISDCSIIIGDNCTFTSNNGGIGGISYVPSINTTNVKAIYGNNTRFIGGQFISGVITMGAIPGPCSNIIVLFKNNTYLDATATSGGILDDITGVTAQNVFALYNDYSIIAPNSGPIVGFGSGTIPSSVLANTCGSPISGSNVTNMSTTSLDTIIAYLEGIPYLADLIPYIQQTYCYRPPNMPPPCPCTAYLCNSNPQVTNYDESEDKSRMADQMVHSNVDVKLAEMWSGTRVQSVPIFKSYQEMMMYKQGSLKYRR
jgi:hypothetical protein